MNNGQFILHTKYSLKKKNLPSNLQTLNAKLKRKKTNDPKSMIEFFIGWMNFSLQKGSSQFFTWADTRPHNFVNSYKIYKLSYFVDAVANNLWMGPNKALLTAQWLVLRPDVYLMAHQAHNCLRMARCLACMIPSSDRCIRAVRNVSSSHFRIEKSCWERWSRGHHRMRGDT